tara:strand:- start:594 stop:698 length:105 start_codon:yes stop_codon:yes gene_type:complete
MMDSSENIGKELVVDWTVKSLKEGFDKRPALNFL